ncbi:uncharacterized protein LOC128034777 [Gossypium raimondii]|uniref:uncharacterized protein LOC128034777 n=1 Tax=Gossypium raimondii TaxID=29730 RepID=UPI00227C58E7|nr:uncharacterized protein LOC128034777 [Gossypium raimondii]
MEDFKKLSSEVFRHIGRRKRLLPRHIDNVQVALDRRFSSFLLNLEMDLQIEYEKALDEEESLCRQKVRVDWHNFGDRNTKYFHNKAVCKRSFNKISALKVKDSWCFNDETLKKEAIIYFSSLFSLDGQAYVLFPLQGYFSKLDQYFIDSLAMDVYDMEICNALSSIGLKAPGTDGLHIRINEI